MSKVKALVIIDMQMGFMNEHTEHLVEKIKAYASKNKFDFILATEYINHKNTACYIFENWKSCMRGTVESFMVPQLRSLVGRPFEKDKYSCWTAEFRDFIRMRNIDQLYFVGVNTGCCVLHSAFDAYNDLQECFVIEDLCGSTSGPDSHKAAIQVLRECITKERVITSDTDIAEL